jgi:LITAF-like zinc ribbon domain
MQKIPSVIKFFLFRRILCKKKLKIESKWKMKQKKIFFSVLEKAPSTTVVIQQLQSRSYGPTSQIVMCPSCKSTVKSKVKDVASTRTHFLAILLCAIGCCSCCLIPYCVSSCQNQHQYEYKFYFIFFWRIHVIYWWFVNLQHMY